MATATLQTYNIDKSHSEAVFQVRHLITKVRGKFSDFDGVVQFSESSPEQSSVSFTIKSSSVDTREPDRDTHLKSPDFFDVANHPTITFKSSSVRRVSGNNYEVKGTLTIRGVAKAVTLPVTYLGTAKDPWGNQRIGLESETTINRKDYGLNWNAALEAGGFLVGDDVHVSIQIQAIAAS